MSRAAFERVGMVAAVLVFAAVPGFAQSELTGVAKPQAVMTASPDVDEAVAPSPALVTAPTLAQKPSATVFLPYTQTGGNSAAVATDGARRPLADPDAGIVTYVPSLPGEVPDGTVMKAKLREDLSTLRTKPGTRFSAEVTEPLMRDGRVVVPAGAIIEGRVSWIRSGKRVSGGAAIHLEPQSVALPDGTHYLLHARVIDTNSWQNTQVDREGTIMKRGDGKKTGAVFGLTAGSGAVAGALVAGPAGALIGAGVGAGVTTVVWLKEDRQAELPKDLGLVFGLTAPMVVTPEKSGLPMMGTTGGE